LFRSDVRTSPAGCIPNCRVNIRPQPKAKWCAEPGTPFLLRKKQKKHPDPGAWAILG
jgi:hypothetical protein